MFNYEEEKFDISERSEIFAFVEFILPGKSFSEMGSFFYFWVTRTRILGITA
jgi:hypothetical protein